MFHLGFRVNVDRDKDEQEYEDEIMAEVLDLELELEEEYQRKLAEHKLQQEEWKAWRNKQVSFKAQQLTHRATNSATIILPLSFTMFHSFSVKHRKTCRFVEE